MARRGINKISVLLMALALAIFLSATAPILLHHSVPGPTKKPPHQLLHMQTSSRRIGKTSTIETIKYNIGNDEVFNFAYEEEHTSNVELPPDIGGAGRSLLLHALEYRTVWDDKLDPDIEIERCRKYFSYSNQKKHFTPYTGGKRRRVFLGSLIANNSVPMAPATLNVPVAPAALNIPLVRRVKCPHGPGRIVPWPRQTGDGRVETANGSSHGVRARGPGRRHVEHPCGAGRGVRARGPGRVERPLGAGASNVPVAPAAAYVPTAEHHDDADQERHHSDSDTSPWHRHVERPRGVRAHGRAP